MQKLSDIYQHLITETVSRNELMKAMDERRLINIYYDSPHGTLNKGWRRIEPYCYGINKSNNAVLRAWELHGASDTPNGKPNDPLTKIPGWRMFRIDSIKEINFIGRDTFNEPRPKYNPNDKDMVTVYKAVTFTNTVDPEDKTEVKPEVPSSPSQPEPDKSYGEEPTHQDDYGTHLRGKPTWLNTFLDRFKEIVNYKPKK